MALLPFRVPSTSNSPRVIMSGSWTVMNGLVRYPDPGFIAVRDAIVPIASVNSKVTPKILESRLSSGTVESGNHQSVRRTTESRVADPAELLLLMVDVVTK